MHTVQNALAQEYAELERLSQSNDPVEMALGKLYLALVPQFHETIVELSPRVAGNELVAASMQAIAHLVSGLMMASHSDSPQALYAVWQRAFDGLVQQNLALFESGKEDTLPPSLQIWSHGKLFH